MGAAISSFFDNGLHFSWSRAKKQYKRTMYFNGHIDKLYSDFFQTIQNLKKDEAILFFYLDTHLDVSYHLYLYSKNEFWGFEKLEDNKSNYQRIPLSDTNFEEKMLLLENSSNLKKNIVNIKNVFEIINSYKIKNSDDKELNEFKQFINKNLFKSKYKAEI